MRAPPNRPSSNIETYCSGAGQDDAPIWRRPCVKAVITASNPFAREGRSHHLSDSPWPKKGRAHGDLIGINCSGRSANDLSSQEGRTILRSSEMCTELHGRRLWNQTMCLVPSMTVAIYFGELISATALAVVLLTISTSKSSIALILFCCGLLTFTLAEYITHRFVLHAISPVQHRLHHARPREPIDRIFWQIWLAFVVVYLTTGGALVAGALVAYAWYLFVHYCAHQNPAVLPAPLLKHHLDHHRFANRNFGVTTKLWDRVFGTMLR